jgi:hypothetical protein
MFTNLLEGVVSGSKSLKCASSIFEDCSSRLLWDVLAIYPLFADYFHTITRYVKRRDAGSPGYGAPSFTSDYGEPLTCPSSLSSPIFFQYVQNQIRARSPGSNVGCTTAHSLPRSNSSKRTGCVETQQQGSDRQGPITKEQPKPSLRYPKTEFRKKSDVVHGACPLILTRKTPGIKWEAWVRLPASELLIMRYVSPPPPCALRIHLPLFTAVKSTLGLIQTNAAVKRVHEHPPPHSGRRSGRARCRSF